MGFSDLQPVCQLLDQARLRGQRSVLVTVCAVEGSSMRNPGTLMGVAEDGSFAGSLSGGCIENAVVAEALDVLKEGAARFVRFGTGSKYLDIKLPCGGGLDLHFCPLEDNGIAAGCLGTSQTRTPFSIEVRPGGVRHVPAWQAPRFDPASGEGAFGYWPDPRLQIIGHGTGVEALARLARTMGCQTDVLTPDERIVASLEEQSIGARRLERTDQTDLLEGDMWTATIFLFHDHDWEIDLMQSALELPHFYIGAMGGRRAHAFRSEALQERGVSEAQIATIRAPIGLFHSSRDPQTLALSTLGEVVRAYETTNFEAALA
ncbi:MAG: XdhC family protein [Erythrobacter sp.]